MFKWVNYKLYNIENIISCTVKMTNALLSYKTSQTALVILHSFHLSSAIVKNPRHKNANNLS